MVVVFVLDCRGDLLVFSSVCVVDNSSVVYIKSAALGVTRWSNNIKNAFRFGLVVLTLSAGFALGYAIMRYLEFTRSPWNGNLDQPRKFTVNWMMFLIFIIGLPVASTLVPFILGHSGQFNSEYQAWNNACMDSKYTSMFHIRYISTIGSAYSMTVYARDVNGTYHYLGLLPTSDPNNNNVILTTPNFVLYPTTNPIVPDTAAGRRMFSVATNETDPLSSQLIASLEIDTSDDNHSIVGKCITSTEQPANLTTCVDGFLRAHQIVNNTIVQNPSIRVIGNRTKTLEIMYDVTPIDNNTSNSTFLDGYVGSWPSDQTSFMTGDTADDNGPNEVMVESDSEGYILASDGVTVVSSPWPACDGLKVCATSGVAGMIASGWIWENLDQWMWYSTDQCMT
jgi:hypothetical protein